MRTVTLSTAARGLSLGLWVMIGLMAVSVGVLFKVRGDAGDAVVFRVRRGDRELDARVVAEAADALQPAARAREPAPARTPYCLSRRTSCRRAPHSARFPAPR